MPKTEKKDIKAEVKPPRKKPKKTILKNKKCINCREKFQTRSTIKNYCSTDCMKQGNSRRSKKCGFCERRFLIPIKTVKFLGIDYQAKYCSQSCFGKWVSDKSTPLDRANKLKLDLEETFKELEPFLKIGLSLERACDQAMLPVSTIYYYCSDSAILNNHPELAIFRKKIQVAKNYGIMASRNTVVTEIANNKNYKLAMEYLATQDKDFLPKAEEEQVDEFEF